MEGGHVGGKASDQDRIRYESLDVSRQKAFMTLRVNFAVMKAADAYQPPKSMISALRTVTL